MCVLYFTHVKMLVQGSSAVQENPSFAKFCHSKDERAALAAPTLQKEGDDLGWELGGMRNQGNKMLVAEERQEWGVVTMAVAERGHLLFTVAAAADCPGVPSKAASRPWSL